MIKNVGYILFIFFRILFLIIGNNNEIKEWNISEVGENILKNLLIWKVFFIVVFYFGYNFLFILSVVWFVGDLYCVEFCYRYWLVVWCFDGWYDGYRY